MVDLLGILHLNTQPTIGLGYLFTHSNLYPTVLGYIFGSGILAKIRYHVGSTVGHVMGAMWDVGIG